MFLLYIIVSPGSKSFNPSVWEQGSQLQSLNVLAMAFFDFFLVSNCKNAYNMRRETQIVRLPGLFRMEDGFMDIQKIISELVSKLTGNKDLIAKFTADPVGAIKSLLGIDIDKDQVGEVVKGVTSKLGDLTGDVSKEATGFFAKIKKFFGIK